jgi:hypothetical protein
MRRGWSTRKRHDKSRALREHFEITRPETILIGASRETLYWHAA